MRTLKTFPCLLIFFLFLSSASADFELSKWQYQADIQSERDFAAESVGELVLEETQIYEQAQQDLGDLRIIDGQGNEVAYVLETASPHREIKDFPVKILNQGLSKNDETVTYFVADLGQEGLLHNKIEILTSSQNFRRQVDISGSSTLDGEWVTLTSKASIYDYTLEFTARNTSVSYPQSTFRYVSVRIYETTEKPLNILGAKVSMETESTVTTAGYSSEMLQASEDGAGKVSTIVFDLGRSAVPTHLIDLRTDSVNFHRTVLLQGGNDQEVWYDIIQDVIFSYYTTSYKGSKLEIDYPEQFYRYYRLTVFNQDNQPIPIQEAFFEGYLRSLVFWYKPQVMYSLYYGNPEAFRPQYDFEQILKYQDNKTRTALKLGPIQTNSAYVAPPPAVIPITERYPYLLNVILVLLVAVVGFVMYKVFRRTR